MVAPDTNGVLLAATLFDKIRIAENLVLDAPGPAIVATSARDFVFETNTILSANQVQALPFNFGVCGLFGCFSNKNRGCQASAACK
jgi:hypothetical protein